MKACDPMEIIYRLNPPADSEALNALSAVAWGRERIEENDVDWDALLRYCLGYVCAFADSRLVGFVKLAWDGGMHAFLLDTMVHPDMQHNGIGRQLVAEAVEYARKRGVEWVHVDYEAHLDEFYRACGFRHTLAGLINTMHDDWSAE